MSASALREGDVFVASAETVHLLRLSDSSGPSVAQAISLPSQVLRMTPTQEGVAALLADKRVVHVSAATEGFEVTAETRCNKRPVSLAVYRLSPERHSLLYADKAGEFWATDLPSMRRSVFLGGHCASVITDLAVSPCGSLLATCDRDEKVRLSSLPSLNTVRYCLGHGDVVTSLCFVPELRPDCPKRLLCSVSWDFTLLLWDYSTGRLLDRLAFDGSTSRHKEVTADGDEALLGDRVYDEGEAGNFPFKVVAFPGAEGESFAAVAFRGEAIVQVVRILETSEGCRFGRHSSLQLPSLPSDILNLAPGVLCFILEKPSYMSCYSVGGTKEDEVVFHEKLDGIEVAVGMFRDYCAAHGRCTRLISRVTSLGLDFPQTSNSCDGANDSSAGTASGLRFLRSLGFCRDEEAPVGQSISQGEDQAEAEIIEMKKFDFEHFFIAAGLIELQNRKKRNV